VRAHCLAHLAKYKVPERFVAVAKLPRNAMGKIVRAELPGLSGPP
jgi:long-chain acyl-CoA synthetase